MNGPQHPLIRKLSVVGAMFSLLSIGVGTFLYLEEIHRSNTTLHEQIENRIREKEALDDKWLELDRHDHQAILDATKAIRGDIELLEDRLTINDTFLYQLGLRDGRALCESVVE